MREVATSQVRASSTHDVEALGKREIDANHANRGTWHIRSRLPYPIASDPTLVSSLCRSAGLPLTHCERDHTDGQKGKQAKRASNKMRFNVRVDFVFHKSGFRIQEYVSFSWQSLRARCRRRPRPRSWRNSRKGRGRGWRIDYCR